MKFGKFSGKIPFLKRGKEEESNQDIAAESEEQQYELSPEEAGAPGEGEEGANNNGPQEQTPQAETPPAEESKEPSMKAQENKGKSGGEPAAEQPPSEKKDSKAVGLMDELLKEIQSNESSPVHILAESLDDVDINYLLTEGRTMVIRLKRRTGKVK